MEMIIHPVPSLLPGKMEVVPWFQGSRGIIKKRLAPFLSGTTGSPVGAPFCPTHVVPSPIGSTYHCDLSWSSHSMLSFNAFIAVISSFLSLSDFVI